MIFHLRVVLFFLKIDSFVCMVGYWILEYSWFTLKQNSFFIEKFTFSSLFVLLFFHSDSFVCLDFLNYVFSI